MDGGKDFQEWMVTNALRDYLKGNDPERVKWFFDVKAETPNGQATLRELSGLKWSEKGIGGGWEIALNAEQDAHSLEPDHFKSNYQYVTPDFRYWEQPGRIKQLFIEAKGTIVPSKRDDMQAVRYFDYFQDSGVTGALVYFILDGDNWLGWLEKRKMASRFGAANAVKFGVVKMKDEILPTIATELIQVVGNFLVDTSALLKNALKLREAKAASSPK